VTDGLFLRRLQDDPALDDVGCVVFDEFHERGLEADLTLALTLESRGRRRPWTQPREVGRGSASRVYRG
jgi:ATP-dependent helicase HrpB